MLMMKIEDPVLKLSCVNPELFSLLISVWYEFCSASSVKRLLIYFQQSIWLQRNHYASLKHLCRC